jgi:hypothetical protein
MLRKSLFAVLLVSSIVSCKKSGDLESAGVTSARDRNEAMPAEEKAKGYGDGEGGTGRGEVAAAPAAPRVAAASAGDAAPMKTESGMDKDAKADDSTRAITTQGAAGVRAGEWDDNANYRDYVKWLKESSRNVARLDVSDRQFIVVKDSKGKPVPNCKLSIKSGNQETTLVTMASGRALWFPHAYANTPPGDNGDGVTVTALCGAPNTGVSAAKIRGQLDTITQLVLASERQLPARRTIDLAFVLDTTGSMSEEIDAVKATIKMVAEKLSTDQTDVRIGLVEYKDRGDELVTKAYPFSSNLSAFSQQVSGIAASGGGDLPEDMQKGVQDAIEKLSWRSDAVSRMVVVIADAPPHLDYQDEKSFADSAKLAASKGIKLFTVSASGMNDTGQIVMRQMAQFTGASNMFVLRGGAGPQSVGGGDPKSSCGGTQEQYASGKLDRLILNKVKAELAAVDGDPMRIAGIGKDESSKPCNERIVMAY